MINDAIESGDKALGMLFASADADNNNKTGYSEEGMVMRHVR